MSIALQLFPLSDYLEKEIRNRFNVVEWYKMDRSQQKLWLENNADRVVAAITAGHIGCDSALIKALPNLKIIATNGVGFDKVDVELAASRGVYVTTTPGLLSEDVADLAVGLTISLLRKIPSGDNYVRQGQWLKGEMPLARKVTGRTFGILGLGAIGSAIADRLAAFGEVHYTGRSQKDVAWRFHSDILSLAKAADVFVIACAANAETKHLVNAKVLNELGSKSFLINISRGAVVDELALIDALEGGKLAGAALDVFADEPNVPSALIKNNQTVLTPHIASATEEIRKDMADCVLANLDAIIAEIEPPTALRQLS